MTTLRKGTVFQIHSYKHDGTLHRQWLKNIILYETEHMIIGTNNETNVIEADKKEWTTEERALFYFPKHYWFNVVYIFREETPYFYCNISSPFTYRNNILTYVDYDLDVIVNNDFSYKLLDEDEYALNKRLMNYNDEIDREIRKNVVILKKWIEERKDPFNERFIHNWANEMNKLYVIEE